MPPRKTEDEENEYERQQFYMCKLEEAGFSNISIPEAGNEVKLQMPDLYSF
jgi:hypothetical protein